jgi:hypothetical protein
VERLYPAGAWQRKKPDPWAKLLFQNPAVHVLIRVKLLAEKNRETQFFFHSRHSTRKKGAPLGRPRHLLSTPLRLGALFYQNNDLFVKFKRSIV